MTTNIYQRLRALLPEPAVLLAKVLEIHADGTSTVELPLGIVATPIADGLSTGATMRVRGTAVPIGGNAIVRSGVIESQAPSGSIIEAEIGAVAELPFGPEPIASAGPVPAQSGHVGVAGSLDLAPYFTGGYAPNAFTVASGSLPAWAALDAATGVLSWTPATTGTFAMPSIRATDSTWAAAVAAAFSLVVT